MVRACREPGTGDCLNFIDAKNLKEALTAKGEYTDYHVLAGGTDLCVLMNGKIIEPKGLISIWGIEELKGLSEGNDAVTIQTLTTHSDIIESDLLAKYFPALVQACQTIGARQIQNRGTIGGNVMNASPAGDVMPALLVYDAEVMIASERGHRSIPFKDLHTGYKQLSVHPDEILVGFKIPKPTKLESAAFIKIGSRRAQAISKIMGAFRARVVDNTIDSMAIAYGCVAPIPLRLFDVESQLVGKKFDEGLIDYAADLVLQAVAPIDDIRSTADYRSHVASVLIKRFLRTL